jgi:hypothetical protein
MPSSWGSVKSFLYSIQTVYNLHWDVAKLALLCKSVIEIPISEPVTRLYSSALGVVTPATAIVIENEQPELTLPDLKIVIETNEGVTVEPILVKRPNTVYNTIFLLTLPRGTTGIKNVDVLYETTPISNDLTFVVMKTPYNYENYLTTALNNTLEHLASYTYNKLNELETRVTALENKAGV